ncbi:MAG: hypothetical protein NC453_15945 [Muribaculum sp.]|nr:hypothetical protein [Muribaculum sp.]
MIKVDKTKEPASWTKHRLTPGAKYEATDDLRASLLKDQGYICAYCMRRIPVKDNGTNESSRIEHIKPQSVIPQEETMGYGNMVICCPGASVSTDNDLTHCDRHKGETQMSLSPLDKNFIDTLSYGNDGAIKSSSNQWDSELNTILNLNLDILKRNRKKVLEDLIRTLKSKGWDKTNLEKIYMAFSTKDKEGKRKEYCGIVLWYVAKKLRQMT